MSASPLLLHIPQAQSISSTTLSELLYVLAYVANYLPITLLIVFDSGASMLKSSLRRHPSLLFRVLLSVPSTSLFTANLHHIDPTLIDLSVLRPQVGRRKVNPVKSLLQVSSIPHCVVPD